MKTKTFSFRWFRLRFWVGVDTTEAWVLAIPLIYGQGGPVDDEVIFGVGILLVFWAVGFEVLQGGAA